MWRALAKRLYRAFIAPTEEEPFAEAVSYNSFYLIGAHTDSYRHCIHSNQFRSDRNYRPYRLPRSRLPSTDANPAS